MLEEELMITRPVRGFIPVLQLQMLSPRERKVFQLLPLVDVFRVYGDPRLVGFERYSITTTVLNVRKLGCCVSVGDVPLASHIVTRRIHKTAEDKQRLNKIDNVVMKHHF